jgi:hypothetical protein
MPTVLPKSQAQTKCYYENPEWITKFAKDAIGLTRAGSTKMFFCIKRKFYHPFQQLIRGITGKVLQEQFFHVKPACITKLRCTSTRSKDKVPVSIVDDDQVAFRFKTRPPEFSRRALESVGGKTLARARFAGFFRHQLVGYGYERGGSGHPYIAGIYWTPISLLGLPHETSSVAGFQLTEIQLLMVYCPEEFLVATGGIEPPTLGL